MSNKQWQALCPAVGHPEWLEDERFKTPALRDKNANQRLQMTQDALLEKSAEEWLDILEEAGVPCAPVLKRKEVIDHPVVVANNLIQEIDHPVAGKIRQTRPAARFSQSEVKPERGAPLLGQHNAELLSEIGYSESDIADLQSDGIIRS